MRYALVAILVAVPLAVTGWVVWRGHQPPTWELTAEEVARSPSGALGGHAPAASPAAKAPEDPEAALRALLKSPLASATAKGEPALYDEKNLYDYIDGAAPLYLQRHFRRLAAAELATADGAELTCDVYDMSAEEHAQSIFDAEKSSQAKAVAGWERALTGPMSFVFQQGRYYVKLTAFDAKAEAALPGLAQALRERIR